MGELFNAISKDEQAMIDFYIDNYVPSDDEPYHNRASLDVILRPWERNKVDLFNMFGKKLILSKDYQYKQSFDDLVESIRISDEYNHFRTSFENALNAGGKITFARPVDDYDMRYYYSPRDIKKVGKPGHEANYAPSIFYLDINSLADNRCITNYSFIMNNDNKLLSFPKDTKYMKMLGRLSHILGIDKEFETFRLWHSLALNNKMLHGNLCISIHPLDFMTMSDNESGWDSCMSWQNRGCYRMGTVEMMNSPVVVIAYLAASTPMKIGYNHNWNNKKWRELFVIDQDVITEVKPYPYRNDELADSVLAWLNELTGNKYSDNVYQFSDGQCRYENLYRINAETNYMYNDFQSCQHRAVIKLPIPAKIEGKVRSWHFNYSGPTECMWCGTTNGYYDADSLLCNDCDEGNAYYCAICGDRIHPDNDDSYYDEYREEYVCECCYNEYYVTDELTDTGIHCDDSVDVYIAGKRDEPIDGEDLFITTRDSCINRYHNYNNEPTVHRDSDYGIYYVNIDECNYDWLRAYFRNNDQVINYIRRAGGVESYAGKEFTSVDNYPLWNTTVKIPCPKEYEDAESA